MKKFSKKLALMLVLAMIVGMFSGVMTASAANAPFTSNGFSFATSAGALKNGITLRVAGKTEATAKQWYTVYKDGAKVNGSSEYKVVYSVDTDGATMLSLGTGKYNGLVRAVSVGQDASCRLTATIFDADNTKVATISTAIYVRESAAKLEISNKDAAAEAIIVGKTLQLNALMYNAAGQSSSVRKTYVTDYTKWTSSDETIATVDANGLVTGVKEGTAKITVATYVAKDFSGTATQTAEVEVTVKADTATIKSVNVTSTTQMTVVFSGKSAYTAADVALAFASNNVPIQVKSFTYDSTDATKAYITTYTTFTNATKYTVKIGSLDKVEVTASIGVAAKIVIESGSLLANTASVVPYKVYDANGVDVTSAYPTSKFTVSSSAAFDTTTGKITMGAANTTATIKFTLTTWDYTAGTSSSIYSNENTYATFTAVANTATAWKYTTIASSTPSDWTATAVLKIAKSTTGKYLFSSFTNNMGGTSYQGDTGMIAGTNVTYTSLNNAVCAVSTSGELFPYAAGDALVLVTCGSIQYYVTITVTAPAITSLSASAASASISTTYAADSATITFSLLDQYGDKIAAADATTAVKLADGVTASAKFDYVATAASDLKTVSIKFTKKTDASAGVEYLKVTYGGKSTFITLTLSASSVQTGYAISALSVDSYAVSGGSFYVHSVDGNGVKIAAVTGAAYVIKNASGTTKQSGTTDVNGAVYFDTMRFTANEFAAGTYTVTVTVGTYDVVGTITVTSTRTTPTITVSSTEAVSGSSIKSLLTATTGYTIVTGGVTASAISPVSASTNLGTWYVTTVSVRKSDYLTTGDAYVYSVAVNKLFTASSVE